MEIVADEFSSLRSGVSARFSRVSRHFEIVDRRLERMGDGVGAISRRAERFDRTSNSAAAAQACRQRVIDDLVHRGTRLEQRMEGLLQ